MASAEFQLQARHIRAVYEGVVLALSDVSLNIRPGEIVALLGSNGAGKTTTLRAVTNLLPAERGQVVSGSISFEGTDVKATRAADLVRRGLVQVLEGRHCFRGLTVEENLLTGALGRSSNTKDSRRDLDRVYAFFPRLKERRKTLAGLTSGGEQQMTAIGRALTSRPRLLVLDEPSMGLAPLVVQGIFRTLKHLNRDEGLSILLAEQNSAIALQYADRAVVLEHGISALQGDASELRQREYIRAFYLGAGEPKTQDVVAPVANRMSNSSVGETLS